MININVRDMREELKKLDSCINEYNDIHRSLFQTLSIATDNWKDSNSIVFNEKIYKQKNNSEKIFNEVKDRRNLFSYILTSYETIGNDIKFDLNIKNDINNEFDFAISKLRDSINHYNNAYDYGVGNYSSGIAGIMAIDCNCSEVEKLIQKIESVKSEINNIFNRLEYIEQQISNKIEQLEIVNVEYFDMN